MALQSIPRPGHRHFGVPIGGPFDLKAHVLANALVGNPAEYPTIELSGASGKFEVKGAGEIGWVGAGASNSCLTLSVGDQLQIDYPDRGCRSYIAMAGGVVRDGKSFSSGIDAICRPGTLPEGSIDFGKVVRVVRDTRFPELLWREFIDTEFKVDSQSNRIGVRLIATSPLPAAPEQESEPVDIGVIQIPGSGHPIILGPDGPTIGGYPRLGFVATVDLRLIGQCKPGDAIRFLEATFEEAKFAGSKDSTRLANQCEILRGTARK